MTIIEFTNTSVQSSISSRGQRVRATGNMRPAFVRGVAREAYLGRYDRIPPVPVMLFPELPSIKPAA